MAFKITYEKLNKTTWFTKHTPSFDKSKNKEEHQDYLQGYITIDGTFWINKIEGGLYGYLKSHKRLIQGKTKNLITAKKKIRELFKQMSKTYD